MERTSKVLLASAILLLVVFPSAVGGRKLKDEVEHPQNFIGGGMGSGGLFPSPGGGLGFGLGPSVFCSFPGSGCAPVGPTFPGGSTGSGPLTPLTPPIMGGVASAPPP
ncbi:hypothetical protein SLA2020_198070 [Shorea laevis]